MEENNKDDGFIFAEGEQKFAIVKADSTFKIDETKSENLASTLKEKAVAKLAGIYTAKTAGKKRLKAVFNYVEGSTELVETETVVVAVKLEISLISPNAFPTSLPKNFSQKVEFVIKYNNEKDVGRLTEEELIKLAATGIIIEGLDDLADVTITKEMLDGLTVVNNLDIKGFQKEDPKESKMLLEPGHQFRIKGMFTMPAGIKKLVFLCKYDESKYLSKTDEEGAKLEREIKLEAVEILSEVKKNLPAKIKLGSEHHVEFQFTNQNEEFAVTGVNIDITEEVDTM